MAQTDKCSLESFNLLTLFPLNSPQPSANLIEFSFELLPHDVAIFLSIGIGRVDQIGLQPQQLVVFLELDDLFVRRRQFSHYLFQLLVHHVLVQCLRGLLPLRFHLSECLAIALYLCLRTFWASSCYSRKSGLQRRTVLIYDHSS